MNRAKAIPLTLFLIATAIILQLPATLLASAPGSYHP